MTGWLVDLLINEFIHHNFEVMAAFRFHLDYVNQLLLYYFTLCYIVFSIEQSVKSQKSQPLPLITNHMFVMIVFPQIGREISPNIGKRK